MRETQIAQLVSTAKLNKEIAFELCLAEGTIKEYLHRLFRKVGVKNRTELALWAVRNLAPTPPGEPVGPGFSVPMSRFVQ